MDAQCPYCRMDTVGQHEAGCPNYRNPNAHIININEDRSLFMDRFYEVGYAAAYQDYERKLNNIKTYYEDVIKKLEEAIRNLTNQPCDDHDCEFYRDCCRMRRHDLEQKVIVLENNNKLLQQELYFWKGKSQDLKEKIMGLEFGEGNDARA